MNMFKHFDRYLGRTVFIGTLFALLVLFAIDSIIDFINDVESVDERGFTFGHVMLRLLFEMPQRLYEFMPTALLLGALIGLGGLAARSELVALRSVGISKLRIIWSVLKVGIVLIAISVWVGEMVASVLGRDRDLAADFWHTLGDCRCDGGRLASGAGYRRLPQ